MKEPQSQLTDCRDTHIIHKIRESLLSRGCTIDPYVIARRIQELFPSFDTPKHPPYALMIQRAITELNDPNGSTEEAISEFIEKEFQDLPWAHTRILGLHLGRLCQDEEILCTESGRYKIMVDCDNFGKKEEKGQRGRKKRKKSKRGSRNHRVGETREGIEVTERSKELQERENDEQNQLSELHGIGNNEMIEEQEKSEIGLLGMTEECHGRVFHSQVEAEMPENKSTGERERESEGTERSNELQERDNEEQNQLSVLHGTGTNEMIEERENSEIGLLGMTEECHGRVVQAQVESETPQNKSTGEPIQEAMMELNDKIRSSEIMNTEPHMGEKQNSTVIKKHFQCNEQPYNLLAGAENQTATQQIEVTTEISRFFSDEISNNENLSASLGSPTTAVIPKEKLQISEQEEQHENETPSIQQKLSGACELLVDQEGSICQLETTCSSQPIAPDLPVDLTSSSGNCSTVPVSTEFLECTPSEGIELTPKQLQMQTSKCGTPETDLCAATKMLASLSSMTIHEHNQPHDAILGSPKGGVDDNTTFGDLEKHAPSPRCSERQPNQKPVIDYPVESLLPSDGSIVDKQKPKYYKIKKHLQLQPQGQGRGRGRGRGRSPMLDRNPHQHEEQLQLQDQALGSVSFPSLEPNETIYSSPGLNRQQLGDPTSEESLGCIPSAEVSALLRMSWDRLIDRDLGTTSKVEDSLSFMNVNEDKPLQHENIGVPEGKLSLDGKTDFEHLEQQPPKRQRRGRPPKSDDGIYNKKKPSVYNTVKHRQLQSPRRRGMVRPAKHILARGCRELQGLKLSHAYQSHQQLQLETCQGQGRRLLRSSLTKST